MSAEEVLLSRAKELGAVSAGIIEARRPNGLDRFYRWLDDGCNADMTYLSARREAYADANAVLPGVRSMVVLAMPQETESLAQSAFPSLDAETDGSSGAVRGRIAFYAVSEDYHSRIRRTLKQLAQTHRELFPNGKCRGVVDTAPILEKDAALTAGLGYIGKTRSCSAATGGAGSIWRFCFRQNPFIQRPVKADGLFPAKIVTGASTPARQERCQIPAWTLGAV